MVYCCRWCGAHRGSGNLLRSLGEFCEYLDGCWWYRFESHVVGVCRWYHAAIEGSRVQDAQYGGWWDLWGPSSISMDYDWALFRGFVRDFLVHRRSCSFSFVAEVSGA